MLSLLKRVDWYVRRLRVMSLQEIVHRCVEWRRVRYMKRKYDEDKNRTGFDIKPQGYLFYRSRESLLPGLRWNEQFTSEQVEWLLDGNGYALGFKWRWRAGDDACWHRSPDSDKLWPEIFFSEINYRYGNPYGDARVVWEPSRLQHLVELALLARTRPEHAGNAAALVEQQLLSWSVSNRYCCGVHYISAMECALRIISICYTLDLMRLYFQDNNQLWKTAISLIEQHAMLIEQRLSLYSSTGNHTIAEAVGLIYAGMLFPEMKRAGVWKNRGIELLENEVEHQILADGGGVEQAFWYHLFVLDLYGLTAALLDHTGEVFPKKIRSGIDRGRYYLGHFAESVDQLPRIGDADDGYALSRRLLISWDSPVINSRNRIVTFRESGYSIVSGDNGQLTAVVDHGPLGMKPSCGHGHADALSMTVSYNNKPLLVDPGTYTYTGDQRWRRYFRSTRAHNTIVVDGQDQAKQESAFLWSQYFNAELVDFGIWSDEMSWLLMRHNGYYQRFGVTHWRMMIIADGDLYVWDYLEGSDNRKHQLELNWHFGISVDQSEPGYRGNICGEEILIALEGGMTTLLSADEELPGGWCSPEYGVRREATTIRSQQTTTLPHQFVTTITIGRNRCRVREFEQCLMKIRQDYFSGETN